MEQVIFHFLTLCAVCCCAFLSGCAGTQTPKLAVSHWQSWTLPAEGPRLPAPRGLGIDQQGRVLVLDNAGRVLRHDRHGQPIDQWWMPHWDVGKPEGILELDDGRIVVADTHYHRVVIFAADGSVLHMFGSEGTGAGEFIYPVALTSDDSGHLYVAEYGSNDRIQVFDKNFQFVRSFGGFGGGDGQFQRPGGIDWYAGKVYVCDAFNNRIQVWDEDGSYEGVIAADIEWRFPYDLTITDAGIMWVIEYGAGRVTGLQLDGTCIGRYGSAGDGRGHFSTPWGITATDDGSIYVADTGNHRLVEIKR